MPLTLRTYVTLVWLKGTFSEWEDSSALSQFRSTPNEGPGFAQGAATKWARDQTVNLCRNSPCGF